MEKKYLTHAEVGGAAKAVAVLIANQFPGDKIRVHGVPRGGVAPAYLVANYLAVEHDADVQVVDDPADANVFVDDIIDSGKTKERYYKLYAGAAFFALFNPTGGASVWLVFPWEGTEDSDTSADDIPTRLLEYIGENPARGGLEETPKRFLKAWDHYTSGYEGDPEKILKVFKDGAESCDEMVLIRNIPIYSHCEHHLAPFFGVAHVGYIPSGSIVGLSKLSRLVDMFARRLQVQERLTNQIADALEKYLKPLGVAVVIECRHMCMESRGIQQQGSSTITSAMRGALREDEKARAEFMTLIKG